MRRSSLSIAVAVACLCASVGVARATTGALELVHPPRVTVPYPRAAQFQGRYVLQGVGRGANIRSGELKIEFSPGSTPQFLVGVAQFYEYNAAGQLEIGLFSLYPFRSTDSGVETSIYKKGIGTAGESLGTLTLDLPSEGGSAVDGEIEFHGAGPYPVIFSTLAAGEKRPANPPPAKQLGEATSEPTASGWGAEPSEYEGDYELTEPAPDETGEAGFLGPVISATQYLGQDGKTTGGEMTVSGGRAPNAEVKIESGSFALSLYLDELAWRGDLRVAKVHVRSSSGPIVGDFEGSQDQDTIKGTVEVGETRFQTAFERRG